MSNTRKPATWKIFIAMILLCGSYFGLLYTALCIKDDLVILFFFIIALLGGLISLSLAQEDGSARKEDDPALEEERVRANNNYDFAEELRNEVAELRTSLESEKGALRTCVNSYTADRRDWREQEEILLLCLAEDKRRVSALKGVITKLKRRK